jgi:tetratricopeptide (TPR) repeat protein
LNALLALIDSGSPSAGPELFMTAAGLASSSSDRLRLLKRASKREASLYAEVARAIMDGGALSQTVLLAGFDAFMRSGRYADASEALTAAGPPAEFPLHYAELIAKASTAGVELSIVPAAYARVADAVGDPSFFVQGALSAMRRGMPAAARELARAGLAAGASLPLELLWDLGLFEYLADLDAEFYRDDPAALELVASAAYRAGRYEDALAVYELIAALHPEYSWRIYAALGRLAASETAAGAMAPASAQDAAAAPRPPAELLLPTGPDLVERAYERLLAIFGGSPEARLEYAYFLSRRGRVRDATAALEAMDALGTERNEGFAAAALGLRASLEPARARAIALDAIARHPAQVAVVDQALAVFASGRLWANYRSLRASSRALASALPRAWFWDAIDELAVGGYAAALERFDGPTAPEDAYAAALGAALALTGLGRHAQAAERYAAAVAATPDTAAKARSLVREGESWRAARETAKARTAFMAALSLDPAAPGAARGLLALDAASP